jgi:heme exporter protein B
MISKKLPNNKKTTGSLLKSTWWIFKKDIVVEMRGKQLLSSMLVFSLLIIFIFNFALDLNKQAKVEVSAGVLWVTFAFAGTLGLNRSMSMEKDEGILDGMLLAPIDRSAIYFGKLLGNLTFMLGVEIILIPIYGILYPVNLINPGLWMVFLLGSIGYSVVGTLLSSMVIQTKTREMLLPILLFPVILPVLILAVKASSNFLLGIDWVQIKPLIQYLLVYDVIFIGLSYMFFDFIVED